MIFGNLHQLSEYDFLKENIKSCFAYAAEHDLVSYDTGRHEIDKDNRYVNIVEYRTQEREQRFLRRTGSIWIFMSCCAEKNGLILILSGI